MDQPNAIIRQAWRDQQEESHKLVIEKMDAPEYKYNKAQNHYPAELLQMIAINWVRPKRQILVGIHSGHIEQVPLYRCSFEARCLPLKENLPFS